MSIEVEAASVFGAQYYVLEQLGFRKLTDVTFMMGALVPADVDEDDVHRYFRALKKAQRDIARALGETLAELHQVTWPSPGQYDLASDDILSLDGTYGNWLMGQARDWVTRARGHSVPRL